MAKSYRPVLRDQPMLLPVDMREWLPSDHLVWFVLDTVDVLDIDEFERGRRGGAGAAGYDPRMLLGLLMRGHPVVVIAEGAGQDLVHSEGVDASGNARLADIGALLRERLVNHFARQGTEVNVRYVDPGYAIRSVPANGYDGVYCTRLAHAAVHAAMAGRTSMLVGLARPIRSRADFARKARAKRG